MLGIKEHQKSQYYAPLVNLSIGTKKENVANPQLENGYIKIATEIMEALINYRIPGEQMQCLLFIIRKTYGWNKKEDFIALSQFVEATGIKKQNVCRALRGLIDKNIVIKKDNESIIRYCFNKKYKTWKSLSKKITLSKKIMDVIKKDNAALSKKSTTIDTITKDTIQKKKDMCPHDEIIKLYNTILGDELPESRTWNKTKQKNLNARWNSKLKARTGEPINSLAFWELFFNYVKGTDYLMGRVKNWRANLGWLVIESNFDKVYEGVYNDIKG